MKPVTQKVNIADFSRMHDSDITRIHKETEVHYAYIGLVLSIDTVRIRQVAQAHASPTIAVHAHAR